MIEELDPLYVCDLLFEDRAIEIIEHDTITEFESRNQQVRTLLETVKENKNDCFHFFLYTIQNEYSKSVQAAITDGIFNSIYKAFKFYFVNLKVITILVVDLTNCISFHVSFFYIQSQEKIWNVVQVTG